MPADAPNIGFEKGNYDGWTQTGTVWSKGPIKGDTIAGRNRGRRRLRLRVTTARTENL